MTRVRQNVAEQLSRSANYTCTETLERSYYRNNGFAMALGGPEAVTVAKNKLFEDRLRLDLAVSEGKEIYAWHGASQFSTSELTDIVGHGPVSTGQFVGYLRNIFAMPGIEFTFPNQQPENKDGTYRFDFVVPLKASGSHVRTSSGDPAIPFHGWFTVRASNLQLIRLDIVDDQIPAGSNIESAHTVLQYQMARMFGRDTIIPSLFILEIQDDEHVFTVSRGAYSNCHEFSSESRLRFDIGNGQTSAYPDSVPLTDQPFLPAGLSLQIGLITEINDETAYAGDPVQGVLLKPVRIPGTSQILPKKAVLQGVITRFAAYYQPEPQYDLRIEFRHLTAKNKSYRLHALHVPTGSDRYGAYATLVPESILNSIRDGSIFIHSKHVRIRKGFSDTWKTVSAKGPG